MAIDFQRWCFMNGDRGLIRLKSLQVSQSDEDDKGSIFCEGYPSPDFVLMIQNFMKGCRYDIDLPRSIASLVPSTVGNQMQIKSALYELDINMIVTCSFSADVVFVPFDDDDELIGRIEQ